MQPDSKALRRTALIALAAFAAMLGLSFAAAPLYSMFCRVTGYDGTTQRATVAPSRRLERRVEVRFDTHVSPDSPLLFEPEVRLKTVRLGETGMAYFRITNPTDRPVRAVATYNVTPEQTGPYFKKLECFCFQQQTFAPRQTIELPVVFFVDPAMVEDRDTRRVREITLSYTYFDAGAREVKTVTAKAEAPLGRVVATP